LQIVAFVPFDKGVPRPFTAVGEGVGNMALAELVSPHLPYLRRFSRALTGSQASGDAYVEALLEAIIADPSSIDSGTSGIRTRLYALLCRLWESIGINMQATVPNDHWERAAQLKLANIAPRP
jgi:hypothetical protein